MSGSNDVIISLEIVADDAYAALQRVGEAAKSLGRVLGPLERELAQGRTKVEKLKKEIKALDKGTPTRIALEDEVEQLSASLDNLERKLPILTAARDGWKEMQLTSLDDFNKAKTALDTGDPSAQKTALSQVSNSAKAALPTYLTDKKAKARFESLTAYQEPGVDMSNVSLDNVEAMPKEQLKALGEAERQLKGFERELEATQTKYSALQKQLLSTSADNSGLDARTKEYKAVEAEVTRIKAEMGQLSQMSQMWERVIEDAKLKVMDCRGELVKAMQADQVAARAAREKAEAERIAAEEARKAAEAKRKADEKEAARAAREKAAAEKEAARAAREKAAAEQKAAREAERQRKAEQKAAEEAEKHARALQKQAEAEAEARRIAEEKARFNAIPIPKMDVGTITPELAAKSTNKKALQSELASLEHAYRENYVEACRLASVDPTGGNKERIAQMKAEMDELARSCAIVQQRIAASDGAVTAARKAANDAALGINTTAQGAQGVRGLVQDIAGEVTQHITASNEKLGSMVNTAGRVGKGFSGAAKTIKDSAKSVSKSVNSAGDSFFMFRAKAFFAISAIAMAVAAFSKLYEMASDIVEVEHKLTVAFSSLGEAGGGTVTPGVKDASQDADDSVQIVDVKDTGKDTKTVAEGVSLLDQKYTHLIRTVKATSSSLASLSEETRNATIATNGALAQEWLAEGKAKALLTTEQGSKDTGHQAAAIKDGDQTQSTQYYTTGLEGYNAATETAVVYTGTLKSYLDDLADAWGLNKVSLEEAAATFKSMTNAMAESIDSTSSYYGQLDSMTTELALNMTTMASDVASLWDVDYSTVTSKFQSALAGQTRAVRSFGIDITEASLVQEAAMEGVTISGIDDLQNFDKAILIHNSMVRQMAAANGDWAQSIESPANRLRVLRETATTLGQSIGGLLLPVISAIIPVLTALAKVAIAAASAIFSFFSLITGHGAASLEDYIKSVGSMSAEADDTSSSLDNLTNSSNNSTAANNNNTNSAKKNAKANKKAAKAAKEFQRQLMGFDEINNITTNKDTDTGSSSTPTTSTPSTGGVGSGDVGGLGLSLLDYTPSANDYLSVAQQIQKNLEDALANGGWWGVGQYIGTAIRDSLNDALDKVTVNGRSFWGNIQAQFAQMGADAGSLIRGIFDVQGLGVSIGRTIAAIFNTGIAFAKNFLRNINFAQIANQLFDMVWNAFNNIDWGGLGETIGRGIGGALSFLGTFVGDTLERLFLKGGIIDVIQNIGSFLIGALMGFLSQDVNIKEGDVFGNFLRVVEGLVTKITGFFAGGKLLSIAGKFIPKFFKKIVTKLIPNGIKTIVKTGSALLDNMFKSLGTFLSKKFPAISDCVNAALMFIKDIPGNIKAFLGMGGELKLADIPVLGKLVNLFAGLWSLITDGEFWSDPIGTIQKHLSSATISDIPVIGDIADLFSHVWDGVTGFFADPLGTIGGALSGIHAVLSDIPIIGDVVNLLSGIWDSVTGFFADPLGTITGALSGTSSGGSVDIPIIGGVVNTLSNVWNTVTGFFADPTGTIDKAIKGAKAATKDIPVIGGIVNTISNMWDAVQGFMKDPKGYVDKIIKNAKSATKNIPIISNIVDIISNMWDTVSGFMKDPKGTIDKCFKNLHTNVSNIPIIGDIVGFFADIWTNVTSAAGSFFADPLGTIQKALTFDFKPEDLPIIGDIIKAFQSLDIGSLLGDAISGIAGVFGIDIDANADVKSASTSNEKGLQKTVDGMVDNTQAEVKFVGLPASVGEQAQTRLNNTLSHTKAAISDVMAKDGVPKKAQEKVNSLVGDTTAKIKDIYATSSTAEEAQQKANKLVSKTKAKIAGMKDVPKSTKKTIGKRLEDVTKTTASITGVSQKASDKKKTKKQTDDMFSNVTATVGKVAGDVKSKVESAVGGFSATVGEFAASAASGASSLANMLGNAVSGFTANVGKFADSAGKTTSTAVQNMLSAAINVGKGITSAINKFVVGNSKETPNKYLTNNSKGWTANASKAQVGSKSPATYMKESTKGNWTANAKKAQVDGNAPKTYLKNETKGNWTPNAGSATIAGSKPKNYMKNATKGGWSAHASSVNVGKGNSSISAYFKDKMKGSFTITKFLTTLTGAAWKALKAAVKGVTSFITQKADGGFVSEGQMFIAREAGPELVGTIGGRTAVANNDQIVASVSRGVASAVAATIGTSRSSSSGGNTTVVVSVDGYEIIRAINATQHRAGRTLLEV